MGWGGCTPGMCCMCNSALQTGVVRTCINECVCACVCGPLLRTHGTIQKWRQERECERVRACLLRITISLCLFYAFVPSPFPARLSLSSFTFVFHCSYFHLALSGFSCLSLSLSLSLSPLHMLLLTTMTAPYLPQGPSQPISIARENKTQKTIFPTTTNISPATNATTPTAAVAVAPNTTFSLTDADLPSYSSSSLLFSSSSSLLFSSSFSSSSSSSSWHPMDFPSSSLSTFRFDGGDFQQSSSSSTLVDNVHAREFETAFCRDFYCCGLRLVDLHDLLQHYEECHVRFEDDDDDDGDYYDEEMAESDFVDEDGWSDSDSAPASPSSIEMPGSSLALALGTLSSSSGGGIVEGHVVGMTAAAAAATAHLYPTFQAQYPLLPFGGACPRVNQAFSQHNHPIIHSTHPLYRHPSNNSSSSDVGGGGGSSAHNHNNNNNNTSTAYTIEAFTSGIHGPMKRKAAVSPADLYHKQDDREDSSSSSSCSSSAFTDTILRTVSSSSTRGDTYGGYDDNNPPLLLNPLAKRFAAASTQHCVSASLLLEKNNSCGAAGSWLFPSSVQQNLALSARLGPIGPLSTLQQQQQQVFHHHSPFVTAAVDLMRQRDEVYSLMEDLSRTGTTHNTGDKPYRCTVLGCDKAYKNPNGLKYHNLHGHCTGNNGCDGDSAVESRPYVCTFLECGKRYKNLNGLKYHIEHSHPNLTAALKAHQSGLIHSTDLFGQYPSQAAMTVAAAVQAVNSSPMMMAAANAILASQAANANNANAASAVTATMPPGGPQTTTTSPLDHQRLVLGPRVAVDGGGGGGEGIGPPGVDPRLVSGVGPGIGSSPGEIKDNMCG